MIGSNMDIDYTVQIWKEDGQYVSLAMPLDVASSGPTPETAHEAVDEAVGLFIETAKANGNLVEILEECGYQNQHTGWNSPRWFGVERHTAPISD